MANQIFGWRGLLAIFVLVGATAAVARGEGAATRPAGVTRVVVLPFGAIGDRARAWVGKAVQEGIVSGVRDGSVEMRSSAEGVDSDTAGAIKIGQSNAADVVIFGNCQIDGEQARITGQVVDVHSGKSLGGIHSEMAMRELFNMEDALASQAQRLMRPAPAVKAEGKRAVVERPTLNLTGGIEVYQPRYFQEDVRSELAIGEKFQAERDHYNYSQLTAYPYCYGSGWYRPWGFGGRGYYFYPGTRNGAGFSDW